MAEALHTIVETEIKLKLQTRACLSPGPSVYLLNYANNKQSFIFLTIRTLHAVGSVSTESVAVVAFTVVGSAQVDTLLLTVVLVQCALIHVCCASPWLAQKNGKATLSAKKPIVNSFCRIYKQRERE